MAGLEGRYITGRFSDKRFDTDGMAEYFRNILGCGVIGLGQNLLVEAEGDFLRVYPGAAHLSGYLVKMTADGGERIALPTEVGIYRVVLRADGAGFSLKLKKGTAGAAPELERTGEAWEISLAQVHIGPNGRVAVEDERADKQLCGVCGLLASRLPADMLDLIHPVGSIYMSCSATDPEFLFGGKWEAFGKGRTLVGVDPGDADFNGPEKTGGSKTARYSLEHDSYAKIGGYAIWPPVLRYVNNGNVPSYVADTVVRLAQGSELGPEEQTQTRAMRLGGTTDEGNNMPPYITCYLWRRIG